MQQALDVRATIPQTRTRPARRAGLDRWSQGVVIAAAILSLGSAAYFYAFTDMLTMAGDMATHLNLARRVIDNLTPGFGNLGGYWLPLLHALEIPFIWHDGLWRSGLAGGIVSMASFVVGSLFTFKLACLLLEDNVSALIAAAIFLTNPMLLYFQTAPMFEPLLIATFVAAIYYLARWTLHGQQLVDLILCGVWTTLATLVRHDNWMLLLALPVVIYIVSRRLWKDRAHREAVLSAYVPLAAQGVLVFVLVLNWILLGNPFHFFEPSFGAEGAMPADELVHIEFTKGHLAPSFIRYPLAVAHNTGFLLLGAFLMGLLIFAIKERLSSRALVAYTLLLPFGFYFVIMFLMGSPPIMVPELVPFLQTFWNVRYGITALPAVAIFVAYLARNHWLKLCATGLIAVQLGLLILGGGFYPNHATEINGQLNIAAGDWAAIEWLRQNALEGFILMSTLKEHEERTSGDTIIIHSGFPNRRFINESTQHYWEESLEDPGKYAQWIVAQKGGLVSGLMARHPERFSGFDPVFELPDGTLSIYRKRL